MNPLLRLPASIQPLIREAARLRLTGQPMPEVSDDDICPACGIVRYPGCHRDDPKERARLIALERASLRLPIESAGGFAGWDATVTDGKKMLAIAQEYVERLFGEEDPAYPPMLLFHGAPGCGKTHMAAAIVLEAYERYHKRGAFWSVPDLLDHYRETYGKPAENADTGERYETTAAFDARLRRLPLLVLDDLGAEHTTDWARGQVFKLVDYRYANRLPLVVTSNSNPEKWGDRLASRVLRGTVLSCEGGDYRARQRRVIE